MAVLTTALEAAVVQEAVEDSSGNAGAVLDVWIADVILLKVKTKQKFLWPVN